MQPANGQKASRGRPIGAFKEVKDPADRIEQLAGIGCTDEEIAAVCDIGETTLKTHYSDLIQKGREAFKTAIRHMQFRRALEGSDTMLVWLGKVVLRQRESTEVVVNATDSLAAFIDSIREASAARGIEMEVEEVPPRESLPD